MKKVIIIDDDAIVRQSLSSILTAKGYQVVANGKNANEAENLYFQHKPDIILMDIRMNNSNGLTASQNILAKDKDAKILLLTTFHDQEYIDKAMRLGCKGYILKENISDIAITIESVLNNKMVYDQEIIQSIIGNKFKSEMPDNFSERENEILKLVADGLNNKEIAQELFLSEGTVRNYISIMLSKLNLRDRTQLAVYYYDPKTALAAASRATGKRYGEQDT